jgi:hypothetical protein
LFEHHARQRLEFAVAPRVTEYDFTSSSREDGTLPPGNPEPKTLTRSALPLPWFTVVA